MESIDKSNYTKNVLKQFKRYQYVISILVILTIDDMKPNVVVNTYNIHDIFKHLVEE